MRGNHTRMPSLPSNIKGSITNSQVVMREFTQVPGGPMPNGAEGALGQSAGFPVSGKYMK